MNQISILASDDCNRLALGLGEHHQESEGVPGQTHDDDAWTTHRGEVGVDPTQDVSLVDRSGRQSLDEVERGVVDRRRYYVRTDKASGIVNDPNDWSLEHKQPRYIIDLLKRVVTVSLETMAIVDGLPDLDIFDGQ
jgi:hypothetical protein